MGGAAGGRLVRVPRGATGFWDVGAPALASMDVRAFASVCHEAARRASCRVVGVVSPGVTPNFHTAVVECRGSRIAVLGHVHLPLMAVAEVPADGSACAVFVDGGAEFAEALRASGVFRLLTLDELRTDLKRVDLSELGEAELSQVAYWEPETLGELLFNYWD